ncbi:MAG TPA: M28 family peptidase [Longimicrobiales bacterium]
MSRRIRRLSPLVAALAAALATTPTLAAQEIDTLALRAHTRFLANDLLAGRGTGSPGARTAGLYIAAQLERMGISGAAEGGGYFQPVPLRAATIDRQATRVVVTRDGDVSGYRAGEDFIVDIGGRDAFRDFTGEALFAGTAGLARAALEGRPRLDGQVIVVVGPLGREAGTLLPDWVARGAEGVVLLIPEPDRFAAFARARGRERLFVAADVDAPVWQSPLPTLVAGPRLTAAILAGAPIASNALDGSQPFNALPLGREIAATIRTTTRPVDAANIAGLLPGSDPQRRREVVVYTAHLDHLGIGTPIDGDSIYNGFSDNAAGVAMVLAIADALRTAPPARSVLFLFLTGEEKGLLGSSYYAAEPLIPLDRTVAVINLDAGAPPAPPLDWHVAGGGTSTLGEIARRVGAAHGWTAEPSTASPNSDHWPFLRRGIPSIFLIPGQHWEGVDGDRKQALQHRWEHYHQPADHWARDFPLGGLRRYAELALAIGREVADAPDRPRMLEGAGPRP